MLVELGRKLWSLVAPKAVEVRLISQRLPNGALELWPEYWLDSRRLEEQQVGDRGNQFIDGYRVRVPPAIREIKGEFQGRPLRVRPRSLAQWLAKYATKGVHAVDRDTGRRIEAQSAEVEFDLRLGPNDTLDARASLSTPNGVVLDATKASPIESEERWYRLDETIFERPALDPVLDTVVSAGEEGQRLSGEAVPDFLAKIEENRRKIRSVQKDMALEEISVFHDPPSNKLIVDGDDTHIDLTHSLLYRDTRNNTHEEPLEAAEEFLEHCGNEQGYRRVPKGWARIRKHDTDAARHQRRQLTGPAGDKDHVEGPQIPEVLAALAEEVRRSSPWNVYVSERLKRKHKLIDEKALVSFKLSVVDAGAGDSLLQLDPLYKHQKKELRHTEVAAALSDNQKWIRRRDAWVKIDRDKFNAVTATLETQHLTPTPAGYTFSAAQREQVLEALARLGRVEQTDSYSNFLKNLMEFNGISEVALPTALAKSCAFRQYQKDGYHWLAFLRRFGLNGILADDMGLGKTLQALAVVSHSKEINARGAHNPSLIICPVSVMANWEAEAKKFFPGTRVMQYRGANRDLLRARAYWNDIVIAGYTIAANDCDELADLPWNYVILDEAHAIKNPEIQRTQKVKRIGGLHKLALTGTPVQNAASDLWSVFDFLMPGYLWTFQVFRQRYSTLFDRRSNSYGAQAADLRKRVGPFVLRRLKKEVAKDLPDKIIADRIVELTDDQARLYKQLLGGQEARRLRESIERNDYQRQNMNILALLMKLRHICNHPALERNDGQPTVQEAAKLPLLQELLEEMIEGDHRALIFSQFTSMLDIIQGFLPAWGIKWLRIDGKTPVNLRQELVNKFNGSTEHHCMLLSTRAGGLGLNLTGADTVIFYDHDWNPTNDEQAQDRAYRIGQEKNVTVYRLITKGTIEDKILLLQARKRALAEALVGVDEQGFKNLTREELLSLFKFDTD